MSQKALREYSQQYINEMAKDREKALQKIGVAISSLRRQMSEYNINEFDWQALREEVYRVVDKELTGITIKTIGRFRKIVMGEDKILRDKALMDLSNENKKLKDRLTELRLRLTDQGNQLNSLNSKLTEIQEQIQGLKEKNERLTEELANEKIERQSLSHDLNVANAEIERLKEQLESKQKQLSEHIEINKKLQADLASKEAIIQKLKTKSTATERDIEDAMKLMEEQYQALMSSFEVQKQDAINQIKEKTENEIKDLKNKYESEIGSLRSELEEEKLKNEALNKKYTEDIATLKQELSKAKEEINNTQKENHLLSTKLKKTIDDLIETKALMTFFREVVSNSDLAAITILLQMGGRMDLDTLAKSVGVHPIKMRQLFEELNTRDLIDITREGQVVAKIRREPIIEGEES